jgi:hypothetical protein
MERDGSAAQAPGGDCRPELSYPALSSWRGAWPGFLASVSARTNAGDAINVFAVGQVVSVAGTEKFLSVQDRLAKIVLMTDHDVIFDPV